MSWDLVFRALPGATGGGSGAPTTQWDGDNRQAPPGKPQGAELTARDITFSWLGRRGAGNPNRANGNGLFFFIFGLQPINTAL
jgi:hypothetical protein